jgi:hypothetical protein
VADPLRDERAENHWQFIDSSSHGHDSGAALRMVTINADGTWSQKIFIFGGSNDGGPSIATVEMIDFDQWQTLNALSQATTQNNAVPLPDGKILVAGGRNSFHYQMFDPATGTIEDLISSPVPRHDHSTPLLTPNGGVWVMGGNRTDLLAPAQEDLSVPVLEFYQPPYFFTGPRPVIEKAPHTVKYGKTFKLDVAAGSPEIGSVTMLRTGPITHNWTWGNQYVSLPFTRDKNGKLRVTAPPLPGLAIPGDYLLFVVSESGVPSEGKHVRLRLTGEGDEPD